MNIDEKISHRKELYNIMKFLQYQTNKIELLGSSSLKSQQNFSDYDLFSLIKNKNTPTEIKKNIENILDKMDTDPNIYFIEIKLEHKNGEKKKLSDYLEIDALKNKDYRKIDFIKLDFVLKMDYTFSELSIIYKFSNTHTSKEEIIASVGEDMAEYIKDKQYFKALKREFCIWRLQENKKGMVKLSRLFNSEYGKHYRIISNLEAILLLLKHYRSKKILGDVKNNLKLYDMRTTTDARRYIKKNLLLINNEAKKYII